MLPCPSVVRLRTLIAFALSSNVPVVWCASAPHLRARTNGPRAAPLVVANGPFTNAQQSRGPLWVCHRDSRAHLASLTTSIFNYHIGSSIIDNAVICSRSSSESLERYKRLDCTRIKSRGNLAHNFESKTSHQKWVASNQCRWARTVLT